LWRQSTVVDRVLLAYYALLHVWTEVSGSIEWIRFLSVIAFALTVVVIGFLGNRLGGYWCGVIAAVLTASNPLMIDAALDARAYALSALAATLCVYALIRWRDDASGFWFGWFCVAWIAVVLLQLFAVLAVLAVLATVCALRPALLRGAWRGIAVPLGVTVLATAAFALLVFGQRGQVAWIPQRSFFQMLNGGYGPAGQLVYAKLILFFAALGIVIVVYSWWRTHERIERSAVENFVIALAWAALPFIGLVVISYVKPIFVDRYLTASSPGMALAIGVLLAQALKVIEPTRSIWQTRALGISAVLILAGLIVNSATVSPTALENYKGVGRYLDHRLSAGGEIAFPAHEVQASVEAYIGDSHRNAKVWPEDSDQLYIGNLDLRESNSVFDAARRTVWLVEDDIPGTKTFAHDLVSHGYVIVGKRRFISSRTITVLHFQRSGG
jgi:mannosyltransferase